MIQTNRIQLTSHELNKLNVMIILIKYILLNTSHQIIQSNVFLIPLTFQNHFVDHKDDNKITNDNCTTSTYSVNAQSVLSQIKDDSNNESLKHQVAAPALGNGNGINGHAINYHDDDHDHLYDDDHDHLYDDDGGNSQIQNQVDELNQHNQGRDKMIQHFNIIIAPPAQFGNDASNMVKGHNCLHGFKGDGSKCSCYSHIIKSTVSSV